ncbi:PAS domain S-box protein [Sphingomonas sp. RB3P16]|uniref:PAS domain S-box protein n=1 Tax=Parasphingomonas frigoris TaxID=3096163 RepID=UPI002FCBB4F7
MSPVISLRYNAQMTWRMYFSRIWSNAAPLRWMGDRHWGSVWISVVSATALGALALITLALVRNVDRAQDLQEQAQWWRMHTLSVLVDAERIDTALNKALRGERGFVLTRHPKALATFKQGLIDYAKVASELRVLTRDRILQQRRLGELDRRVAAFARVSRQVVDLVTDGKEALAMATVRTGREREAVENASSMLDEIKAEERRLLTVRERSSVMSAEQARRSGRVVLCVAAVLLVLIAGAIAAMLRSRDRSLRSAVAAKESERLYRLLADHSNDLIVLIGLDGIRRYVSPAAYPLLGYRPEEMVGGAPVAAIHVEDRMRVMEVCKTLLEGAKNPVCSYRQQHRDGHYVWLEASYHLIRDDAGNPSEIVASVRDIGQRQAVEREMATAAARLYEHNRLFSMAASLANVGHWHVDLVGGEVIWADEVYRIHAVGHDYIPTLENAIDFYHPDDRERVAECVRLAGETGSPFDYVAKLLVADGSVRNVAAQGQAERAPNGDVIAIFGVFRDITAQAKAQADLEHREEQYRLLADNASDVVLRTDIDGFVTYASPSCVELSGYRPEELVGRHCGEFIHTDDAQTVRAEHVAIVTGQERARTVEYRLRHKAGDWRWLESHMKVWRAPGVASGGVISAIRDIGQRKELEIELIAARDKAESASRVKANFLANMSHEIRTPMNGVLGFTELVLAGELNPEQRRHLELIAESGRSMMRLLNDILDISKIDAGKMGVTQESVDLRHVSRRCADLMSPIANAKGVVLSARIAPSVPERIVGDPLRLRQIMLNLIGNAVKFTDHGSVTVDAYVEGDTLRLDVSDTGVGIPAERLDAIFEQFAQADDSTAQMHGGTGLGLAISAELVRLMKGTISVRSILDQGTTFSVVLPLRVAVTPVTVPVSTVEEPAVITTSQVRRPRVLIAEDHDINQELILAMAERSGMDPALAVDGEEAIAMIEDASRSGHPFELVLMDMQMPRVDGLEATRRLRAAGYTPSALPIVALTANAYADDVEACFAAGMQAHLAKPVRVRDLTAILSRFVSANVAVSPAKPGIRPKLMERYQARKVETMLRLNALAEFDLPSDELVNDATDLLHKLAGSAGMFGEAELGLLAQQLENTLSVGAPSERAGQVRAALPALRAAA